MGTNTNIQWADSSVNPTTGCGSCELWNTSANGFRSCYAGVIHETRMAKALPDLYAPDFTEVRLAPGRMAKAAGWSDLTGKDRPGKPWLNGRPRVIFVGDMGDLLSKDVPFDYLKAELIDVARSNKGGRHIWTVLTKRPERLAEFAGWLMDEHGIAWPANVWPGTSITGKASLRRIDGLMKVPSDHRFLSVEPLVESIDLSPWLFCSRCNRDIQCGRGAYLTPLDNAAGGCWFRECHCSGLSLVIVGGESGPKARPFDLEWARSIVKQCKSANVPAFVKQFGSRPFDSMAAWKMNGHREPSREYALAMASTILKDGHGGDWDEWKGSLAGLKVREFPTP